MNLGECQRYQSRSITSVPKNFLAARLDYDILCAACERWSKLIFGCVVPHQIHL